MNSKRIANALIVFCLLVTVGLWWAKLRPAEEATVVQEAAPSPRPTEMAAEIESPVAAPAETFALPTVDPAVLRAVAAAVAELQRQTGPDPQSQLDTTIPFVAYVLESGDALAILKLTVPPETITPETEARYRALTPDSAQRQSQLKLIALLDNIQEATPIYSEAGDRVTYQFPSGPTVSFRKIDGRWYAAGTGGTGSGKK